MDWILAWRHEALTPLFLGLSGLGDATFFLVACGLGYWLLDRRLFLRISLVVVTTVLLNELLKGIFQVPRPDPSLHLVHPGGWGFPSGHAMVAAVVWPWSARELRRPLVWPLALLLPLGIAASRVYLGVHTPRDVIAGLLVGGALGAALWPLAERLPPIWNELGAGRRAAIALVPVVILLGVLPEPAEGAATRAGGALIGLVLGADIERRRLRSEPPRSGRRLPAGVLGLVGLFVLRLGLAPLFELAGLPLVVANTVRYAAITAFLAVGAPWLFVRLGWARSPGDLSARPAPWSS